MYHDDVHLNPQLKSLPTPSISVIWAEHELKGQGHNGKVKGKPKPPTNVHTEYKIPMSYSFQDIPKIG